MSQRSFYTSGLRVGRLAGIEIWIHWTLLILLVYEAIQVRTAGGDQTLLFQVWGLWILGLFLTIFLHELGHAFAAFRMGGGADAIVLWPLGGLAVCDAPRMPRHQFWVAAGGPLVNVGIMVILGVVALFLPPGQREFLALEPAALGSLFVWFLHELFWLQAVLLIFNLLPIYPLDGGRMFHTILWARLGSYGRASLTTVWTSRFALIALVILSFFPPLDGFMGSWTILIAIWAFYQTELLRREIQEGGEADGFMGYDFSRGYTSLDRTTAATEKKKRRPSLMERLRKRRQERRRQEEAEIRHMVDLLLDKISRDGMQSLTPQERRFLEGASRRLKGE